MQSIIFTALQDAFDKSLKDICIVFNTFMLKYNFMPYFFAFDMTNYSRMMPVYLSQMLEPKKVFPVSSRNG